MFLRCTLLARKLRCSIIFLLFATCHPAFSHGKVVHISPDEALQAVIVPTSGGSENRIELMAATGKRLSFRDHSSPDGQHGRYVLHADWTPDSQFFVYSTCSSGGHSSWHYETFVYARRANRIYDLDDILDPMVEAMFDLSEPDQFHSKRLNPDGGVDNEPLEVRVKLSKLMWTK
jgi:hypothetical protein